MSYGFCFCLVWFGLVCFCVFRCGLVWCGVGVARVTVDIHIGGRHGTHGDDDDDDDDDDGSGDDGGGDERGAILCVEWGFTQD